MATVLKFGKKKLLTAQLDPALKEFIDTVLVPCLVKDAIRDLAPMLSNMRQSAELSPTPPTKAD